MKEKIEKLLDIETLDRNLFRGEGEGGEVASRVFGGHVIAQALAAAYKTVEERLCHSLHAYFIRPGDPSTPIIYEVDRARDGGSFTTRRVVAIQNGKQIFNMAASFHIEEDGWSHQHKMKEVKGPSGVLNRNEQRKLIADKVPEKRRANFLNPKPIEIRDVDPPDLFNPEPTSDKNFLWFKVDGTLDAKDQWVHHCFLAYASDVSLLGSGNRPHGVSAYSGDVMLASLDHAMWFHEKIDFNNWYLYEMDSPFSGAARSLNRGKVFSQDGTLVASVAQEGLMRPLKRKPNS